MKKLIINGMFFCLLLVTSVGILKAKEDKSNMNGESFTIYCSQEMYEFTEGWLNLYEASDENTNVIVHVGQLPSEGEMADGGLYIVNETEIANYGAIPRWNAVIGRQVIVPVINSLNSSIGELMQTGYSKEKIKEIVLNPATSGFNVYISADPQVRSQLTDFLGIASISSDVMVAEPNEMVSTVVSNKNALCFCMLSDIMDAEQFVLKSGCSILPLDRNGNGSIESVENIYGDMAEFTRAVWIGKYPRVLTTNIYAIANNTPQSPEHIAFISWMLTSGQNYLTEYGFGNLSMSEANNVLAQFVAEPEVQSSVETATSRPYLLIAIICIALIGLAGIFIMNFTRRSSAGDMSSIQKGNRVFNENSLQVPGGVLFDKSHTWVFMEKNGEIRIGLDDFIQKVTGTISNIKMKSVGDSVKKGELMLSLVQDGKQLNIYAPVSGKITKQNHLLEQNASIISRSPFEEGWIYMIEPVSWSRDLSFLKAAEDYKVWIKEEFVRLKDFLAAFVNPAELQGAYVYQDGGELSEGVFEQMEPKIWEEFQVNFIDKTN